jgi:hypothetical protein
VPKTKTASAPEVESALDDYELRDAHDRDTVRQPGEGLRQRERVTFGNRRPPRRWMVAFPPLAGRTQHLAHDGGLVFEVV